MGPLQGIKVIEIAGMGPAPFCAMMLGDLGAEVIRIERASVDVTETLPTDPLLRNRRSVTLNLKRSEGVEALMALVANADAFIEGFRPGVAERLGIGPDTCLGRNPRLVYGRMTGWGQSGPMAQKAGHDINFIALSGVLHLIGNSGGKPMPPLNLVGDFGGGGMLLAFGLLAGVLESRRTGLGQVIDASMIDGAIAQLGMHFWFRTQGWFKDETGENIFAGAAPYYDTYRTLDGKYVAFGAIEPHFFGSMLGKLGLDEVRFKPLGFPALDAPSRESWKELRAAIASVIATKTRDEWCSVMEDAEACFTPVLTVAEALRHPHNVQRGAFVEVSGVEQNAPAPRFSRTSTGTIIPPRRCGEDTEAVLLDAGMSAADINRLRSSGAVG